MKSLLPLHTDLIWENKGAFINDELLISVIARENLINNLEDSLNLVFNYLHGSNFFNLEEGSTNEIIYNDELKTEKFGPHSSFPSKIVLTEYYIPHSVNKSIIEIKKTLV